MRLIVEEKAALAIERAALWWRENRPSAPKMFSDELSHALKFVTDWPLAGTQTTKPNVRRYVLQSTKYLLTYAIEENAVRVVGFRHARQRPLKSLR